MQFVQLSVPQELYSQLGLCPNKTVVFKSSKDLYEPDMQDINANAPQNSQATSYSEEPALKVPEVSDWSDDPEESASVPMIASVEEYNGVPKGIIVNASDIDYLAKPMTTKITYPRPCSLCGKMCNVQGSYFKHRRLCKARIKDLLKDANNVYFDSFNESSDNATYWPKKLKATYPRPCLVCGKMSNCRTTYYDHRKKCGARKKKPGEANKPIKKIPLVRYWENDDYDYSDDLEDLYDEELEAIKSFVAQQSTTVNDEGQETLSVDASQLSTDSGNCGVEALGSDKGKLSSYAKDAVVNDNLTYKRKIRRICMNCGHSYANKSNFKKHLKMCEEYKRRLENPIKPNKGIPESEIRNLKPQPDDALVNELIREEKPVSWFPVGTKVCAKPSKNFKYFVVKKT